MINWKNDNAKAIDGFTVREIREMLLDSIVTARCSNCGADHTVEPDARGYQCEECETPNSVTSPLIKLRII